MDIKLSEEWYIKKDENQYTLYLKAFRPEKVNGEDVLDEKGNVVMFEYAKKSFYFTKISHAIKKYCELALLDGDDITTLESYLKKLESATKKYDQLLRKFDLD